MTYFCDLEKTPIFLVMGDDPPPLVIWLMDKERNLFGRIRPPGWYRLEYVREVPGGLSGYAESGPFESAAEAQAA